RPHHDQTADHHHESAHPHPHDEWVERHSHFGGIAAAHASEHDVGVEPGRRADADLSDRLKEGLAGHVEIRALLAGDESNRLSVAESLERHRHHIAPGRAGGRHALAHEAPLVAVRVLHVVGVTGAERDVVLRLEGEPGERGEEHHDAGVDDVAPIAAAVPADLVYESSNDRFTMNRLPRTDALVELLG